MRCLVLRWQTCDVPDDDLKCETMEIMITKFDMIHRMRLARASPEAFDFVMGYQDPRLDQVFKVMLLAGRTVKADPVIIERCRWFNKLSVHDGEDERFTMTFPHKVEDQWYCMIKHPERVPHKKRQTRLASYFATCEWYPDLDVATDVRMIVVIPDSDDFKYMSRFG